MSLGSPGGLPVLVGSGTLSPRDVLAFTDDPLADNRTEFGIGALMPWAGKLYVSTYLSATNIALAASGANGHGSGLYTVDSERKVTQVAAHDGCHTGRWVHNPTKTLAIGVHLVSRSGVVTPISAFLPGGTYQGERIAAWAEHFDAAKQNTYLTCFSMAGKVYEVKLSDQTVNLLANVATQLSVAPASDPIHGKSMYYARSAQRLMFAFNNNPGEGALGRWDGAASWVVLDTAKASWVNIGGDYWTNYTFATGHDGKSALLWNFESPAGSTDRTKMRLPFQSDMWRDLVQQEWMRCRQVESERFLLDAFGLFYELSPKVENYLAYSRLPRIGAIGSHSRIIPDFCAFDGHLVLGGNHASSVYDFYHESGQSGSGLTFTSIDALAARKPTGYGYWWDNEAVAAGAEEMPMLARGFDRKCIHLWNNGAASTDITIFAWLRGRKMALPTITVAAAGYEHYEFPAGFCCDWISVQSSAATTLTARVDYS